MANKLILESRPYSTPSYHPNQFHIFKCKSPHSITILRSPLKTHSTSLTLVLQKPYLLNPTTKAVVFGHEIIGPNFSISKPNDETLQEKASKTPFESILDAISNSTKALRKPLVAAVLACVLIMLYDYKNPAWGASGGRMGGSSFSSSGSSGRSSSSSSSSSGSSSGSSYWSSSSSSYGSHRVERPWTENDCRSHTVERPWTEKDWRNFWIITGFLAAIISLVVILCYLEEDKKLTAEERNSIVKIQVGLLGTARSIQKELNQIALTADTSTSKGINYVLTETTRALLQHPDYVISAYSTVNTKNRFAAGEKLFNQLSLEEREKFDEETLVNVNNKKKQVKRSRKATGTGSEFIVITILAAVNGVVELPTIKGSVELKQVLQKLGSIRYQETIAAEVLWTPQEENDTLSEQELREDYPLLKLL